MRGICDPFVDQTNGLTTMVGHFSTRSSSYIGYRKGRVCKCMQQRGVSYCEIYDVLFWDGAGECVILGVANQLNYHVLSKVVGR
jgi:hypothetical protein